MSARVDIFRDPSSHAGIEGDVRANHEIFAAGLSPGDRRQCGRSFLGLKHVLPVM